MLRNNLKAAITQSGLIVKEISAKSGVKKRTIDKWVGISGTEPKVNDFYKVCKVLETTMEWVVDGEAGTEYVRNIVRNDPFAMQVPDRIRPLVEYLLVLDEGELKGIMLQAEGLAKAKQGYSK